jgi:hypothetical protein
LGWRASQDSNLRGLLRSSSARNPCRIEGAGKEDSEERETVPLPVFFAIAKAVPVRYRVLVLLAPFADRRWGELVVEERCYWPRCRVRSRMKRVRAQRSAMSAGSAVSSSCRGSEVNPDLSARAVR